MNIASFSPACSNAISNTCPDRNTKALRFMTYPQMSA